MPAIEQAYKPFIDGEQIYLRELRLSDVNDNYYRWINDPEVTQYLESRFSPTSIESLAEYVKSMTSDPTNVFMAIILKENGAHIGNVKIGGINWIHRFADVGILLGEKSCWGRGIATETLELVNDYAFKKLNLLKLTAGIYSCNPASTRAFEKAGFTIEGVRKDQYNCEGVYVDHLILGRHAS